MEVCKLLQNTKLINILRKEPLIVIDVGSSWYHKNFWEDFAKVDRSVLRYIGFDPQKSNFSFNKNFDSIYIDKALYKKPGKIKFYYTKNPQCSSILEPNLNFLKDYTNYEDFQIVNTELIEADTLSNQLKLYNFVDVDFIKLDTQGSELFILQGAEKFLDKVVAIEIEAEFKPIYKNQPLFCDVDNFLRKNYFDIFDLRRIYWKRVKFLNTPNYKGELIWGEAVYFKNLNYIKKLGETKLLKAALLALVYKKYDYALKLIEDSLYFPDIGLLFEQIKINKFHIPNFKGRYRLSKILNMILGTFKYNYKNGNYNDLELTDE